MEIHATIDQIDIILIDPKKATGGQLTATLEIKLDISVEWLLFHLNPF